MSWNFGAWLDQHRADVQARWVELARDLPGYAQLEEAERTSRWAVLLEALTADTEEALSEHVHLWAERELLGDVTPRALVSIAECLSQAIREQLPEEANWKRANEHLNALIASIARYTALGMEGLTQDKSRLETLYEITRELTSSLDLRRLLHRTLDAVMSATSATTGAIFIVQRSDGALLLPETTIAWDSKPPSQGISTDVLPSAWQLGQLDNMLVVDDLESDSVEPWVDKLVSPRVRSLIMSPLIAHGELQGLMILGAPEKKAFRPQHVQLLRSVLGQIGAAIGNAELYRFLSAQSQELGQMLRHQQEESTKHQAILTSIADGVVVNNADGETIMVNPAAERILNTSAELLVGEDFRTLFSLFKAQDGQEVEVAMEELLDASTSKVIPAYKTVLEIDDRIINAHLSSVQVDGEDFLGVVTILRDVTKEVEADRAKSEFISTVSHELRTPMTAVKGYTDLIYTESVGSINKDQRRFLGIIKNNTDRLTALINDLLDISRVETGRLRFEPQAVQIGEVIADVVTALAGQAQSQGQTLAYEVDSDMPEVMGDRSRLNQVLTNLVSNAIRYTPEGGTIEIHAYPVEEAVRVDVRDTGIGIHPDDLGHIFERFYRADHPVVQDIGGTGLGLSIVRMFVEMHGGRVWVESEPDEGSTFTFILPMPTQEEEEQVPHLVARMRTILVVDDERDVAQWIKFQLEENGYKVHVLGSGKPVLGWAMQHHPDIIILDRRLPDIDGTEVLRRLNDNPETEEIPVIVLTIMPDDGTVWDLGIADYLIKPVGGEELLRSVEEELSWHGSVLIVDDHMDTVELLSITMRQIGFTPLVAVDGYEALTLARRHRPDLVLLDLRLPGMNGYEVLTHLKRDAMTHSIPIIAFSAHIADVDLERKRLIALGAANFIPKPFSIEELLEEIEEALKPVSGPKAQPT